MENNQGSFLDKNTIIAIVLTIIVWVGWSQYMAKKYPEAENEALIETLAGKDSTKIDANVKQSIEANLEPSLDQSQKEVAATTINKDVKPVVFDFPKLSFTVSPLGMGLNEIILKDYTDREDKNIQLSVSSKTYSNFATKLEGKDELLFFDLKKISETEVIGEGSFEGVTYEKKYKINPETFSIDASLSVKGENTLPQFETLITEKANAPAASSMLSPSMEKQEVIVKHKDGDDREIFNNQEPFLGDFNSVYMASLSSHYFATAVMDMSDVIPNFKSNYDKANETMIGKLIYPSFAGTKSLDLKYKLYFGPKDVSTLQSVNANLSELVDFGMFSFIAEPLLRLMKWFYAFLGNWGLAIIALTVLVRLVVLPFNVMSYKSMSKMQAIQPTLKAVREKYKDDPVRMNQEVMGIMKQEKVNPAGGCLPMLLQFPIFIALYRVLSESIDLYKAPFGLWITDLSLKDPYYVLPILMGISMFLQQKITPSTMDPQQQKVMAFMPIVFSLLMISLPSGLTLYIFVSTIFGVIQQQLFMKKA